MIVPVLNLKCTFCLTRFLIDWSIEGQFEASADHLAISYHGRRCSCVAKTLEAIVV